MGLAIGLLILALLAAVAAALHRAARQAANRRAQEITTPDGVNEAGYVTIGGARQWIQVRGRDRANPILLVLHGGPSMSLIPFTYEGCRAWERHFTVAHWDQRDAGRSRIAGAAKSGPPPSIDLFVRDGLEVAQHLRARLGHEKVVLLGISWGSLLGVEMVRRRPDLFQTYVASGQVVDFQAGEAVGYAALLERVAAAGDARSLAKLHAIGPPPYWERKRLMAERRVMLAHPPASERGMLSAMIRALLFAPDYSLRDAWAVMSAEPDARIVEELMSYDAATGGLAFAVPMIFIQGAEDIQSPTLPIADFMEKIAAPRKQLVILPGLGHMAVTADAFLDELLRQTRPAT